jgi:hypothetical protein
MKNNPSYMAPHLIVLGNYVINLANVTHVEVNGRPAVTFHFSGSSQVISFTNPEAEIFHEFLDDSDYFRDLRVEGVRAGTSIGPVKTEP